MDNKRKIGRRYEEQAKIALKQRGYDILCSNYTCKTGEVDIVALQGGYLVFVEVKYRYKGDPFEAVNIRKQRKMIQVARYYMLVHSFSEATPVRFDVAGFTANGLQIIQNAFEVEYE